MPREYGVPKDRKLRNLSRGLFMESLKMVGEGATKAGLRCRLGCFCLWKLNFEENNIRRMHLNLGHPFTDECQISFKLADTFNKEKACMAFCKNAKFPRNFVDTFSITDNQTSLQRGEGGALPVRAAG